MNEQEEAAAQEFADIITKLVLTAAEERELPPHIALRALEVSLESGKKAMELVNKILGPPPPDEG